MEKKVTKEEIKAFAEKEKYTVNDIETLVEILRSENGCAWDKEQDHDSIRNAIIEETYEFIEGLDTKDTVLMCEELGDVMFQVFFHSQISKENGNFDIDTVSDGVCKKMVLRHPHVFGDVSVENSKEVLANWEKIKKKEKSRDTLKKELESVSSALPSLIRAEKLLSKYKKNGGEIEKDSDVLLGKIKECVNALNGGITSEKIGELLFNVSNLSYVNDINTEQSLYNKNVAFIEEKVKENNEN